jgi:SNF2 family DNA or RNA helicase
VSLFDEVLYPYQQVAASRINESRRILLADQPGLGKTLEVLAGLELAGLFYKPSTILIVTPIINAQTTWRDTLERFVQPRYDISVIDVSKGTASQKSKQFKKVYPDGPVVVLANHDALARVPEILATPYDAVVIDESHMVLPIKDPRKLTNFWKGLSQVRMTDKAFRIAVSGTPDRGKLDNRFGTWMFLHPEHMPASKWAWLEENFWLNEQKVSRTRTVKVPAGLKSEQGWLERDKLWMIRRTKSEVLPQLPPKRYVDVEVALGREQQAAYALRQLESMRKIYDAKVEERDSGEAMVFALRARQLSTCSWVEEEGQVRPVIGGHSAKLEWLLEWFTERGFIEQDNMADNAAKVVIVSSFSKVLHWLAEELELRGLRPQILDGSVSDTQRATIQREFQTGALRIVLLSGSMGVGINLDAADDLIMLDSPYDPDRIEQIEDRVHRASNMHHVTIWNVIAQDTIDQAILEQVSKRYKVTRELMDGSRGVEFGRDILARLSKERSK